MGMSVIDAVDDYSNDDLTSVVDAVDGSSTGIAMCHIAVFEEPLERSHPWNRLAR